ncbi:hypothetical protein SDRG_13895 [Saprolegnia diclina VS20]|uniref:EF-hand domain-containing protein n=1 Tax=Saprolegnia diclina (strain VS20) TaxID=1156394 RepID=T0R8E9_SAPDV|nr:hypothetical protein SDRG_13895 [Saprolegnia diclina VS20]EQC28348.1 hypothetical protein SDRG_13895 [Saprolegnia diclina VS20]|eukprot:XP_008618218.1 hypothetical protein SDRG_13895 [Saprolegnia diclina VS20]
MDSRRLKPGKMQPALSSPNLLLPQSREEFVLEFYNPRLRVGREGGGLSESMKRALTGLDRIGPTSPQIKCVSFVDPLEDAVKRDLRKSHLLHPLPSLASPKKAASTPARCQRCFSSNVVYLPSCAYCEKLQLLSDVNTLAKRYAFNLLEREPTIPPRQLLDLVFGYLYELQDPLTAKRDVPAQLTIPSDVLSLDGNNGSVSKDEATQMIRSAEAAPTALATTRDAILELKQARASIVASKVALSQPTKVSLVQYLLDTFAQPSGAGADWTREQRWDHQDMCVEMLKLLSTDDVDDVLRTYNAWKHVNEVNQKQRAMELAWNQRLFETTEEPRNVQTPGEDDEEDECETSRNLGRPLTLHQKKANRVSVSKEHRRTLIAQHHTSQRSLLLQSKTEGAAVSPAPHVALKELPTSAKEALGTMSEPEISLPQLFLTAERYQTTSSNGMFHIDHLGLLEQAGLSTHDLTTIVKLDRRTQMVYLLADESDRTTLLHLSSLGRVNLVAEWLGRNVDNETLLIAATSAKGQLLSTDERRLILAMDDADVRYHLSFWKQLQHQRAHKKVATSVHFLHLNLPHHERDAFFRVPRYWQKLIKARDLSVQPMPIAVIRPFVLQLYIRCAQEDVDEYDLAEFVVEHMTLSFGAATPLRLQGFITALEQYHTKDTWLYTFCRFCHITERLPAGCFRFYLSAVLCLRFSTPNRSQIADYVVPRELFHPLLATKAKMALQAIARDAHVRDEHWLATFTEMRTVCPRTKGVVSNHLYVVGLSVFMDLVLGIWEANRESMTKEMRVLFEQFDTDHSKSLSYAEFKAFITHCSASLEAKSRPHSPLRRASLSSLLGPPKARPERRPAGSSPKDEKDIIKLYAKCLMQSDKDEVNVESFVLGGLDNPLILTLLGFPVPPTHTSAAGIMALQLVTRAVRAYIQRKRSRAAAKAKAA